MLLRRPLTAKSEPEPYRFSVEDWHKLGEAGLFDEDDRVELMDGEIIIMSPIGSRHAAALNNLIDVFGEQNRRRFLVSPGNPVETDGYTEPLPDLAILPRTHQNASRHPYGRDTYLIVEIADSSLGYDRGRKLGKYATAKVPEYWIVNLEDDVIEMHRDPRGEEYRERHVAQTSDLVSPQAFPDVVLKVAEIIPPQKATDS